MLCAIQVVRKGPNSFELGPSSLYIIYNTYYILHITYYSIFYYIKLVYFDAVNFFS